jgi:dipeptidase E
MGKIIAIGGGEIGRPGYKVETTKIDKEIIKQTGKKHPKLLFIPTASKDSKGYIDVVKRHFGTKLDCLVDTLYLAGKNPDLNHAKQQIMSSDIIYVGGGNTLYMMKIWRKYHIDKIIHQAYDKGIILSGLSAGSICWFNYGHSDSRKMKNPKAPYIKVKGLGIIPALHCPHFDVETKRQQDIKSFMKKTSGICIAIDNCCALEIIDDKYRIISSKPKTNAYKIYWKKDKYFKETIKKTTQYFDIKYLSEK